MPGRWICLIIFYVWQTFEDSWSSKCVRVLNMARLYMKELYRVLNMSEYASICLNNVWISLNIPQYAWSWVVLLNVPKYARECLNKLLWLCQGSQYVSSFYIFDKVLNMPEALNKSRFRICCDIFIITLLLL